jgi:lysophospholipase L1-like esterase
MSDPAPTRSETRASGWRNPPVLFKILFALAYTVVLWVVLVEGVFRVVPVPGYRPSDLVPIETTDAKQRNTGHPYLAYALKPGWESPTGAKHSFKHNALGFRGPETTYAKPGGVYRIVCLGGSSTYGHTESSNDTTWPVKLQGYLNAAFPGRKFEVINGGCSGYSTFESTVNLAFRMVDFQPDLVIVYHNINDMRCALWKVPPKNDNSHWRDVWPRYQPSPMEPMLEKSMTYLILRRYFTDYFAVRSEQGFFAIVDYDPAEKDPYPKTMEEVNPQGFNNFRRNLKTMTAIARAHGAQILFATQANDREDFRQIKSGDIQLECMNAMTRIMRDVAQELGVPVAETATVLEAEATRQRMERAKKGIVPKTPEERNHDQEIFSGEVHLWDQGADLLARTFRDEIVRFKLVQ